ncbi:hypothetical protein N665_0242s0040 [Sinapis alba]|nr:hypothetical protein N665_0242s0040 [Sinapis alba]
MGTLPKHHTARVSWEVVTRPKREGGLGVKNLVVWNKACCLKLIWFLFFQSGSVWVAWFVSEVLKGSRSNLWTTIPHRKYSWQVNKLLKLSSSIYSWIKLRVQNGVSCRFWTDNWPPFGSLRSYLSTGFSSLGIGNQATLASLRRNNSWRLPPARSEEQVIIHAHITEVQLNDQEDFYEWEVDGTISTRLWGSLAPRCGILPERSWDRALVQIQSTGFRSTKGMLLRFCWQGCIYWIWSERNARLHRQIYRSTDTIKKLLDRQIKDKILTFRHTNPSSSSKLMQQWIV